MKSAPAGRRQHRENAMSDITDTPRLTIMEGTSDGRPSFAVVDAGDGTVGRQ